MKIHEIISETTFAGGQDPKKFKSPKGGTPVMMLMTDQGSRYIIASDGMVLRYKSHHSNTGGEDMGMQSWSEHIEYYDPSANIGGTTFPQAVAKAIEKGLTVAFSKTSDGKRALIIPENGRWRVAKISDIFKHVASVDAPIVSTFSTTPKLNWHPMDYDLRSNNSVKRVHPGSPVSHGMKL
jgi:hypothetical protein